MSTKMKVPDTKALEELIDQLEGDIANEAGNDFEISTKEAQMVVDGLTWLVTFLNDRRTYHKRQQVKKNLLLKIAKSKMSAQELAEIDEAAAKEANATILTNVEVEGE